jgi:hypothetical protein
VRPKAPPDQDHFEHRVYCRALALHLDGQDGEKDDLHRGTRGIPEGARDPKLVCYIGALEESRSPCPFRNDVGRRETSRDRAACGGESLRVVAGLLFCHHVAVGEVDHARCEARKDGTNAEHDEPVTCRQVS